MLERILRLGKSDGSKANPKHIALTMNGNLAWAVKKNTPLPDVYRKGFNVVKEIIQSQTELNIPIVSFFILPDKMIDLAEFQIFMELLIEFLHDLKGNETIKKNQIKVSVLGKWYDLPGRLIDPIKSIIEETRDYDKHYLNLCINYSGQDELVDACKLIARKVAAEKIHPEGITRETIKENIYSSSFMPPELTICTGGVKETEGMLLWDLAHSCVFFSEKLWPEFDKSEFAKAIEYYKKN